MQPFFFTVENQGKSDVEVDSDIQHRKQIEEMSEFDEESVDTLPNTRHDNQGYKVDSKVELKPREKNNKSELGHVMLQHMKF